MGWAPGEQERAAAWYASRSKRVAFRAQLELALAAPPEPYLSLYDHFEALATSDLKPWPDLNWKPNTIAEDDVPDSRVVKNQNIF